MAGTEGDGPTFGFYTPKESGSPATIATYLEKYRTEFENDKDALAAFYAVMDCGKRMLESLYDQGNVIDGFQQKSNKAAIEKIIDRVASDGRRVHEAYETFMARPRAQVEYINSDAFALNGVPTGRDTVSVFDPPYYLTQDYKITKDGKQVNTGDIVGIKTYQQVRNTLQKLASEGSGIIYTDEAWWHKDNFKKETADQGIPQQQQVLLDIINALDYYDVAGQVAQRQEVIGVNHGHTTEAMGFEGSAQTGMASNADGRITSSADEGRSQTDGQPTFFGMDEGTAGQDGTVQRSDDPVVRHQFSSDPDALGFYSQIRRTVEAKMPARMTVRALRGMIDPAKGSGIKAEEIEWSGLGNYLDTLQPGDMITKEQALAAIQDVVLKETVLAEQSKTAKKATIKQVEDGRYSVELNNMQTYAYTMEDAQQDAKKFEDYYSQGLTKPKFSTYVLPGALPNTYEETLLTIPSERDAWQVKYERAFAEAEATSAAYYSNPNDETKTKWMEARKLRNELERNNPDGNKDFESSHFAQPNIIVHARTDERILPDGTTVLFIEEIQSDWHQKGRTLGYDNPLTKSENAELERLSSTDTTKLTAEEKAYGRALLERKYPATRIPNAPFKDTSKGWARLMFKRMLRKAIEAGHSAVAWTTGATQADRYDLSKQVKSISWSKYGISMVSINALANNGDVVIDETYEVKDLPGVIGKDITTKIQQDIEAGKKSDTISGDGLRVGGEGMATFYDRIVPQIANDLGKKYGAKAELVETKKSDDPTREDVASVFISYRFQDSINDAMNDIIVAMEEGKSYQEAMAIAKEKNRPVPVEIADNKIRGAIVRPQIHLLRIPQEMANAIMEGQPRHAFTRIPDAPRLRSSEANLAASFAIDIIETGKVPTAADVTEWTKRINKPYIDPQVIITEAKKLANNINPRTEERIAKNYRWVESLADEADRDLAIQGIGAAFSRGQHSIIPLTKGAVAVQHAKDRAEKLQIDSANGFHAAQMQAEIGVDLSKAVLNTPDVQPTAEEIDQQANEREAARAQREADELAMPDAEAPIPVPITSSMQSLLDQVTAEANARADAIALDRQQKEFAKAKADREAATNPDAKPQTVVPAEEEATTDEDMTPKEVYDLVAPAIISPDHFAAFVVAWATRKISAARPHLDPKALFKDPAALRDLQRTAQDILRKIARETMAYGRDRERAFAEIDGLTDNKRFRWTFQDIAYIYSRIHASAIRDTREEMISKLERDVKAIAIEAGKFQEGRRDDKRKVHAQTEKYARNLLKVIRMDPSELKGERQRLSDTINAAQDVETETGLPATTQRKARQALEQIDLLKQYGGMINWMPGQISDAAAAIVNNIANERDQFEQWKEDREAEANRMAASLSMAFEHDKKDKAIRPETNALQNFGDSLVGNLFLRMQAMAINNNAQVQHNFASAMRDITVELGEGAQTAHLIRLKANAFLNKTLRTVYGTSEIKAIKRLSSVIPETVTLPNGTTASTAELSKYGNELTYGRLLNLYAMMLQQNYTDNLTIHQRHKDIDLIKNVLSAEDLQLHASLVQWYRDNLKDLSEANKRITGNDLLSEDPFYTPARMKTPIRGAAGRHSVWSPIVKALSPRVKNKLDFDETRDILDVFSDSVDNTAAVSAYGERGIFILETLLSEQVLTTIDRYHGKHAMNAYRQQVEDILTQGQRATAADASWLLNRCRRIAARVNLSMNPASAVKQLAGVPVFANVTGWQNLGKYMLTAGTTEGRAAIRELMQSDGYKARYQGGWSAESADVLSQQHIGTIAKMYDKGMILSSGMDAVSSLWIGQGIYRTELARELNAGKPADEAKERALTTTWSIIEQTQQSGRQENLPSYMRDGNAFVRLITQFKTSPLQQLGYEIAYAQAYRRGVPGSGAKLARAMLINHVVAPVIIGLIDAAVAGMLGRGKPDDDEENWTFIAGWIGKMLLGQYGSVFILGTVAEGMYAGTAFGAKPKGARALPAEETAISIAGQTAATATRLGVLTWNQLTDSDLLDVTPESILKDLDKLADRLSAPWRYGSEAVKNWTAEQ
jgi:hypothetical protein